MFSHALNAAVQESRDRVLAAVKTTSFKFPPRSRLTINLAAADFKKEGSAYDLPMAIVVLAATDQVNHTLLDGVLILGELALDGGLRPIHGTLPIGVQGKNTNIAHGVLFLDELPEFAPNVLEVMRQPLEDCHVTICRSRMSIDYPSNFMLVCAMNPCLCSNFTDPSKECTCTPLQIQKYMAKISGPLLDRIDLHIEAPVVKYKKLSSKESGESSEKIRTRVMQAREIQVYRFNGRKGMYAHADLQSKDIREYCRLDAAGKEPLKMAITKLGLSARTYDRILRVGRTIADMAVSADNRPEHINEAIQ